jgi:C_GCAxxG_C_C family probable redox protein
MGKRAQQAAAYFQEGCNCSQAVFCAFADRYGIDHELAMKLSSSFGGGMGRMREVCGAFSGMMLVNGLETGTTVGQDAAGKAANYRKAQELAEEFRAANGGSIICRELLGLAKQPAVPEDYHPAARTADYYKKRPCPEIVANAAKILEKRFGD